jgi:hypothetical protein
VVAEVPGTPFPALALLPGRVVQVAEVPGRSMVHHQLPVLLIPAAEVAGVVQVEPQVQQAAPV